MFAERCAGIGLICSRFPRIRRKRPRRGRAGRPGQSEGIAPVVDAFLPRFFAPDFYANAPDLVARCRAIVERTEPRGAAAMLRGMAARVASDDLFAELTLPVALVAGAHDPIISLEETGGRAGAPRRHAGGLGMRALTLVRSSGRAQRVATAARRAGRGERVTRLTAAALALAFAPAAASAADAPSPAPAASPAAPKGPLRHLVFAVDVSLETQTDMRTIDVAANRGGNTEHYTASGSSHGTIACDVMGVVNGNLVLEVTEDTTDRSAAKIRVAVQSDGALVYLPNQGTLTEEETELIPLLAPGLLGGERAVGDAWTYRQNAPDLTTVKTYRLTDVKDADHVSLALEESYSRTGSSPASGTIVGTISYDPGALVPLGAKLNKTTRQEDSNGYKTRKLGMDFALKEDSLAKH